MPGSTLAKLGSALLLCVAPICHAGIAHAPAESTLALEAGAPPAARHEISRTLRYGMRIELNYDDVRDADLDTASDDDLRLVEPVLALALDHQPATPFWRLYTNLELKRVFEIEDRGEDRGRQTLLELDKLYADVRAGEHGLRLRVGRQRFNDPREWLYDDTLDAVRAMYRQGGFEWRMATARSGLDRNLLEDEDRHRRDHLLLQLGRVAATDAGTGNYAYLLLQDDPGRDERPCWLGLHHHGEWRDLDYWIELALVRGDSGDDDIAGHGLDVGGVYRLMESPHLYAIAAYALGSGDRDEDLGFRQTGLEDNQAKLGGVVRVRYYGEVFDPELSNLQVTTLGLGVRPTRDSSLDLLWHGYRQDIASDTIRESGLDAAPEGEDKGLGDEFDLVIGYRQGDRQRLEVVLGRFSPGAAFAADADAAKIARIEWRYDF